MEKKTTKKILTDADIKRKAVKLVVVHIRKKTAKDFLGREYVENWADEMAELLKKTDFNIKEYVEMRRKLNDIIERILDEEMRFKLRDSWYSFGKALDKKVKQK